MAETLSVLVVDDDFRVANLHAEVVNTLPGFSVTATVNTLEGARNAAAVSSGGAWPCGEGRAGQGLVVLICPEGDTDVLDPRLRAAGATVAVAESLTGGLLCAALTTTAVSHPRSAGRTCSAATCWPKA